MYVAYLEEEPITEADRISVAAAQAMRILIDQGRIGTAENQFPTQEALRAAIDVRHEPAE